MILDGALIRRRRQDLSMSQRELSQRLAVSAIVIAGAEEGTNHETLNLGLVAKLAAALAVDVGELILVSGEKTPTEPNPHTQVVGSLLAEVRGLVAVEAIAETLGISLGEVESVLAGLERRLPQVGMVLHRLHGDVAIRPQATTEPKARKSLLRKHQARRGLTLTEAKVLYRVAQGEVDEGKLSNPDGVALNRLRRAGLVTDDVRPELAPDVGVGLSET